MCCLENTKSSDMNRECLAHANSEGFPFNPGSNALSSVQEPRCPLPCPINNKKSASVNKDEFFDTAITS